MAGKSGKQKIKVLVSFGTRPECIKLAPVIKQLENHDDVFDLKVCSTGQHKEMLDQVINFFELKPDFFLNLMTENQTLGFLSSKLLDGMDKSGYCIGSGRHKHRIPGGTSGILQEDKSGPCRSRTEDL
jgi:hypothetical protein